MGRVIANSLENTGLETISLETGCLRLREHAFVDWPVIDSYAQQECYRALDLVWV